MSNLPEIFVETKESRRTGFVFLHDRKFVRNYIHPDCLHYFWVFWEDSDSVTTVEDEEVMPDGTIVPISHMWCDGFPSINKGRRLVRCYDGKFRQCDIVSFRFVVSGKNYNELFAVDKSLRVAGILGKNFKHEV